MEKILKPQLWVWSTSEKHWEFLLKNYMWSARNDSLASKIKKEDRILMYVTERKAFSGIIRIRNNFTERTHPKWPREMETGKVIWKYDWNVKIDLLMDIFFKDIKWIPFIKEKTNPGLAVKGHAYAPSNLGKPLSTADIYALQGMIGSNLSHLFQDLWEIRPTIK